MKNMFFFQLFGYVMDVLTPEAIIFFLMEALNVDYEKVWYTVYMICPFHSAIVHNLFTQAQNIAQLCGAPGIAVHLNMDIIYYHSFLHRTWREPDLTNLW